MRFFLILAALLVFTSTASAVDYMKTTLYQDINLSKMNVPSEREVEKLLGDQPEQRNIVLNYMKSIEYTKGYVAKAQFDRFNSTLAILEEPLPDTIRKIVKDFIASKGYKLRVIDLTSNEYFLPLKFLDADK